MFQLQISKRYSAFYIKRHFSFFPFLNKQLWTHMSFSRFFTAGVCCPDGVSELCWGHSVISAGNTRWSDDEGLWHLSGSYGPPDAVELQLPSALASKDDGSWSWNNIWSDNSKPCPGSGHFSCSLGALQFYFSPLLTLTLLRKRSSTKKMCYNISTIVHLGLHLVYSYQTTSKAFLQVLLSKSAKISVGNLWPSIYLWTYSSHHLWLCLLELIGAVDQQHLESQRFPAADLNNDLNIL